MDSTTDLDRAQLANISNITALRLFNDVDIRSAPPIPESASRVKSGHPLIDFHGWQEVYNGKSLWIYDTQSNLDECVRAVSQASDIYGTATCVHCPSVCPMVNPMQRRQLESEGVPCPRTCVQHRGSRSENQLWRSRQMGLSGTPTEPQRCTQHLASVHTEYSADFFVFQCVLSTTMTGS